jgi:hypothetical protein
MKATLKTALITLLTLVCSSMAFADLTDTDATIKKQLVGSWKAIDHTVVLKENGVMTSSDNPTSKERWDVRSGMFLTWYGDEAYGGTKSSGNNSFKIISLSKTKFVIQDMYHGRHTGTWTRSTASKEAEQAENASPNQKQANAHQSPSDLNWTRIYKIQGHKTDTIVHLSRNGDQASGTYQQKLTVEPQDLPDPHVNVSNFNKIYHFSGKVEEVNGRTFIKNIQFTDSDSNLDGFFWRSPEGIRCLVGEHAASAQTHRPTDALPGDEGLVLTFVNDEAGQRAGGGPTFEKILSLVHVERLQSSTNKAQTDDPKSLHNEKQR